VARAVAEKPGRIYNPLFFHGPPVSARRISCRPSARRCWRANRANVRYVTSEQFTNEFVDAIKKQTFSQFRQKYRKVDVLLIDDVHFFEGKDSTQEEFFHTFNELFNNAKQIVLASDRPPSEIKNLESRLVSRFEWGLATQIQVPDLKRASPSCAASRVISMWRSILDPRLHGAAHPRQRAQTGRRAHARRRPRLLLKAPSPPNPLSPRCCMM
jgi:chromosomal replication initiation ATPase DnaA